MDEKKVYKIGLWPMILIILDIALIATVIVMGMIIHQKLKGVTEPEQKKNHTENKIENTTNTTNNTAENDSSTEQNTAKTVANRPYIYDAQYTPDGLKANSYLADDGVTYKVSDIVVPYVNMVSSDATKMNTEIETSVISSSSLYLS